MEVQTILLALHLLGVAFGIGASTVLDFRLLRLLLGHAVRREDIAFVHTLGGFVRLGLLLLWVSGIGFVIRASHVAPELLSNPKLHAKAMIVVILTLNGILLEIFALPLVHQRRGCPLFEDLSVSRQTAVLALGVISATSWYAAFALGIVRELNFGPSAGFLLLIYLALAAAGIVFASSARCLLYRARPGRLHKTRRLQTASTNSRASGA